MLTSRYFVFAAAATTTRRLATMTSTNWAALSSRRLSSSSTNAETTTATTFKGLSSGFASESQIREFEKEKNSKNRKVVKNKISKHQKGGKSTTTTTPVKARRNETVLPGGLTFGKILEKSPIASEVNEVEIQADRFLTEAAKAFVEQSGDFDLLSSEAVQFLEKSEQLFPIEKADEDQLEKLSLNKPTFSVAAIINDHPTLQRLVDLGVNLSYWEKFGRGDIAMSLDFETNVAPKIRFLVDLGVRPDDLGEIFTRNPDFFRVDFDDAKVRIQYLESKDFTKKMITQIVTLSHARWLSQPVAEIDARLGFLQKTFRLTGNEVRSLAVGEPSLVIWKGTPHQISLNKMKIVECMGFSEKEAKTILLKCPPVYKYQSEDKLQTNFEVLHLKVGLTHEQLAKFPSVLLASRFVVRQRHDFLLKLGRDQYDPKLPNYVSPAALAETSDEEFCLKVAKVPVETWNKFLKTL